MRYVLGMDAGGTKTRAILADESGRVIAAALAGGANLKTHGELAVEKVLHAVAEEAQSQGGARADAVAIGIAGADRPEDHSMLREILSRIGFKKRVVVTNDARVAFVAGSARRVGLALVCGTGSIAWGSNARGDIARAGGWGWHLGDEGSGFWIGMRALTAVMRASDGRGPSTVLERSVFEHFGIPKLEKIVPAIYDGEFPRYQIAKLAPRVEEAALAGDPVAGEILDAASSELILAARSVIARLRLETEYDVVLSGGTFRALPALARSVRESLAAPGVCPALLEEEPAIGAVKLALEELEKPLS